MFCFVPLWANCTSHEPTVYGSLRSFMGQLYVS
ncbi:hypothetical protein LOK49_LG01G02118 [Camellia lanceoleosa]|uniref:Uncharacterized protein n=1 Tax=Camellia lanceoleosa TaxID=1840588 RepID=A0ACC0IYG6_9ERIC|nr:hypothetical protein LOK49_LG01G02118 [Camellia lanceoleosa]